ncbi:MAG TPA: hypothetical protein P5554_09645 [Spirochaetota bacterium]|nr:hypothetical protein [Spirochaetota bacterium]
MNNIICKLLILSIGLLAIGCVTTPPPPPEMTEAEKAVMLIEGFASKDLPEIKRIINTCTPVGAIEYIPGQYVARKRAVELKANTAHLYYYDDLRQASVVRFWQCK